MSGPPSNKELVHAILRTPAAKGLALLMLLLAAGLGGGVMWLIEQAHTGSCEVSKHRELEIEELIAVKKRFMAYRKAPDQGMRLSGEEIAMLIEDQTAASVFLEIEGQAFRAELALASEGGRCWPLKVEGEMSINEGKAFVSPSSLTLGSLDLTPLIGGTHIELLPEHMPNARSANLLGKTRAAAVVDGGLQVQLRDPQASLFTND